MTNTVKQKIVYISNEIRLEKEGKNPFQNFDYFRPDDIAKAINPLLEKHKIIIKFNMPFDGVSKMYQCSLTVENIEDENKEEYRFDIPLTTVKGSSEAQGAGATMTYAKRYMIMNVFNIAENANDLDSKQHTEKPKSDFQKQISDFQKQIDDIPIIEDVGTNNCQKCGSRLEYKESKVGAKKEWRGNFCTSGNKDCPVEWLPKKVTQKEIDEVEGSYPPPPEYGGN